MKLVVAVSIAFTILISVTGCASDDDEAPVESRIKNSMGEEQEPQDIKGGYADDSAPDGGPQVNGEVYDNLDRDAKLDLMRHHINDEIKVPTYNYVDDDIFKGIDEEKDSLSPGYRESNKLINDNINSKIKVPTYNYVDEDLDAINDIHDDDTIYDD